ncbi:MAG: helix-turn-helix domain-containing protein [Planctomycetota bacterium]|nr:helix-turn-helix domain-containing protein [Planctomycetota bacterium]
MIRPDLNKWGQSTEELRLASITAEHPRTRERFLALYLNTTAAKSATQIARQSGHRPETVIGWVHRYNEHGPDAIVYRRTGGRLPLFR